MNQEEINQRLTSVTLDNTARISALEDLVKELAMQVLGKSSDTEQFLKTIDDDFHKKRDEIKNFWKRI